MLKKKFIPIFYLMFPNIKKVKILTPIISNETMQSNLKCIQQSFPLQFCCFIQLCDQQKIEWHVPGWKISPVYKKTNKRTNKNPTTNMQDSCYFVSVNQFTNFLKFRSHTELKIFSCPILSNYPTESTNDSPNTVNFEELR